MTCPRCGSSEHTEPTDTAGWWWCDNLTCRSAFKPEQPARLVDLPARVRRDTD